jgi:hypothetical protein
MIGTLRYAQTARRRCLSVLALLLACGVTTADAEVNVQGSAAAVRVVTSQNSVAEVMSALGATFNIRYRSATPLDGAAQATYSGPVEQVLSRLLDGYNYVIKRKPDAIEVIVLGRGGSIAIPPPAPKPAVSNAAAPKDVVSRWR